MQSCCFLSNLPEVGGSSTSRCVADEPLALRCAINSSLCALDLAEDSMICHPTWVKHFNSTYKKFSLILLRYSVMPVFGKIDDLLVLQDGSVFFYVQVYATLHFDEHYHGLL